MCESDADNLGKSYGSTEYVPIRGVALDMDGLLFDTEKLYWQVGDTVLQRRGHRFSAELQQRMMGRVGVSAIQQMIDFHLLNDNPNELLAESEAIYDGLLINGPDPMPGLALWIDFLREKKIRFGLSTSSQRKYVDRIFSEIEWRNELSFVLTGDDVVNGKPHPEMYLKAASLFEIDPGEMLVLEDSGNGCAAGVASGAQTVAVPSEHTQKQNFAGAILVAKSLHDPMLWDYVQKRSPAE